MLELENQSFSYRLSMEMAALPFLRFLLSISLLCLGHFSFCVPVFVYVYFRGPPHVSELYAVKKSQIGSIVAENVA